MEDKKPTSSDFGLQADGSVKVDVENDYCIKYFKNMSCWKKPIETTTGDRPWIKSSSWKDSYAMKYLNYETEDSFIDLDNPLLVEEANEIRTAEKNRAKKKTADKIKDFKVTEEGITDMNVEELSDDSADSDNFLDEYGNIIDQDKSLDSESESVSVNPGESSVGRKRKKRQKKNKKKMQRVQQPAESRDKFPYEDYDNMDNDKSTESRRPGVPALMPEKLKLQEPRYSSLNGKEQWVYLTLLEKFQREQNLASLSKEDQKDYQIFQGFHSIVREEQEEFQKFAKDTFLSEGNTQRTLDPNVRRYIDEYYEHRLRMAFQYPRLYEAYKLVSDSSLRLLPKTNEQQVTPQFQMRVERTLVEMGTIPKIMLPNRKRLQQSPRIPGNYDKMNFKVPTNPDLVKIGHPADRSATLHKTAVSRDANAERLAKVYLPSVVMSMSALKAIFDNFGPLYDREWDLPFTVRTYDGGDKGGHRVVFLDKPLPAKALSAYEKNQWYNKVATKVFLLHPWTHSTPRVASSGVAEQLPAEKLPAEKLPATMSDEVTLADDDPFDSQDLTSYETFGTTTSKSFAGAGRKAMAQVDGGNDSDSDEEKLVIVAEGAKMKEGPEKVSPVTRVTRRSVAATTTPPAVTRVTRSLVAAATNSVVNLQQQQQQLSTSPRGQRLRTRSEQQLEVKPHVPLMTIGPDLKADPSVKSEGSRGRGRGAARGRPPLGDRRSLPSDDQSEVEDLLNVSQDCVSEDIAVGSTKVDGEGLKPSGVPVVDQLEEDLRISPQRRSKTESLLDSDSEKEEGRIEMETKKEQPSSSPRTEKKAANDEDAERKGKVMKDILDRKRVDNEKRFLKRQADREARRQQQKESGNLLCNIMASQSNLLQQKPFRYQQRGDRVYQGEKVSLFDHGLDAKDFLAPPENANVSYRLWKLWNKDSAEKSGISILLRSSTHGLLRGYNGSNPTFTVGCKMETQSGFGAEMLSRSELARDWISTMARPDSSLARLRIDSKSHAVLLCDSKNLKSLTSDGLRVDFKPAEQLGNVHTLLQSILQGVQEPGQYLLRHDAKSGAFVRVYKAAAAAASTAETKEGPKGAAVFDLHLAYNTARAAAAAAAAVGGSAQERCSAPWNPIDVSIITPWHYENRRVPGLFSPFRDREKGGREGGRGRGRGGRGGRGRGRK